MKIIVVGGAGTVGKAVVTELSKRHKVIVAGRKHGDVKVDITNLESIKQMYKSVGDFDAVVSTAGNVHFGPLVEMSTEKYAIGLQDKLMGQVNLVMAGMEFIKDNGSFTLTSGILSVDPIRFGVSASMVNAAVDGFVIGAAIELTRGCRINAVSPTLLTESVESYGDYFHGFETAPAARVALAFSKSVEGAQSGKVYKVGY